MWWECSKCTWTSQMKLSCAYQMITRVYYNDCKIFKNIPVYNNPTMCFYNLPACGTGGSIDKKGTIVKYPTRDKFIYIVLFLFHIQTLSLGNMFLKVTILPLCHMYDCLHFFFALWCNFLNKCTFHENIC